MPKVQHVREFLTRHHVCFPGGAEREHSPKLHDDVLMLPVSTAMDARLEVGLEQQAELMLKMMATLHADSILQALTSSSSTGKQNQLENVRSQVCPCC